MDVDDFIRKLAAAGFTGAWGIEMISRNWRELTLHEQATWSAGAMMAALKHALAPSGTAGQPPGARAARAGL